MTENEIVRSYPAGGLHGRRQIFTDKKAVTKANVVEVLGKALAVHQKNAAEERYLYGVYRGVQDIRDRPKKIRPDIKNIVVVNRANEIATFKTSFLLGEPIQYVSQTGDEEVSEKISELNAYMYSEGKAAKDKEIADWLHICGVGVRITLPDPEGDKEGSPAAIYTLEPMVAFNIYYSGIGHKRLAGVVIQKDENGETQYSVYTDTEYFLVKNDRVIDSQPHTFGRVPIIEYVHNEARLGAFEIVLPLLNAINTLESNRLDDVEQFVQSILVFKNCELDEETASELREKLGLMLKSDPSNPADVYRLDGQLSQDGAQLLMDDLYDSVLTICGMPNRNGGSSTSDTGAATIMRDGWSAAESRAKDTELLFARSERDFLRVYLKICADLGDLELDLSDVGIKFTRRNYSDIQSKAQVLSEMLNNDKIHPKLAFQVCGLFTDSEEAYRMSMEYAEEEQAKEEARLQEELNRERSVQANGQSDRESEQPDDTEVQKS